MFSILWFETSIKNQFFLWFFCQSLAPASKRPTIWRESMRSLTCVNLIWSLIRYTLRWTWIIDFMHIYRRSTFHQELLISAELSKPAFKCWTFESNFSRIFISFSPRLVYFSTEGKIKLFWLLILSGSVFGLEASFWWFSCKLTLPGSGF